MSAAVGLETSLLVSSALELSAVLSAGIELSDFSVEEASDGSGFFDVSDDDVSDETTLSDEADDASADVSVTDDTTDDTALSGPSEREVSLRSPQPDRRAAQTAVHKKAVESFLIFIVNRPFLNCVKFCFR